jgi:hypothetical protein
MLRARSMPFCIRNYPEHRFESEYIVHTMSSITISMRSYPEDFLLYSQSSCELFVFTIVQYLHLDFERTLM